MNEIEQIILQSLRHLGCDFVNSTGESIDTLELLSSDEIIEAVIRLLWQCDPKFRTEITSCKTPSSSHTLERFKLANQIVRCLKKIGIDQEFQGLLYPSTYETRRMFMSLLEKMPKEEIKIEPIKLSPIEQMRLNIARILFEQLKRTWQRRCEQSECLDNDENYESMRKHFQPSRAYVSHIRSFLEDDQDPHLQQNWIKTHILPKEGQDLSISVPTQTNK